MLQIFSLIVFPTDLAVYFSSKLLCFRKAGHGKAADTLSSVPLLSSEKPSGSEETPGGTEPGDLSGPKFVYTHPASVSVLLSQALCPQSYLKGCYLGRASLVING